MFPRKSEKRYKQFWMLIPMLNFIIWLCRKDVKEMTIIYATLIVKGKKTFAEVPAKIKDKVKEVLIDLDCGELADE